MSNPTSNIHLLNCIDNSGNLEYRGSAVYPHLVPELQNCVRMFEYCSLKEKNIFIY